jgi:hypothetical protein
MSFLVAHIDHRTKLDFILLMHRQASAPLWIVASELGIPKPQVREMADELVLAGILRITGDKLELAPQSPEIRLAIVDLVTWYAIDRARVFHVLRSLGRNV